MFSSTELPTMNCTLTVMSGILPHEFGGHLRIWSAQSGAQTSAVMVVGAGAAGGAAARSSRWQAPSASRPAAASHLRAPVMNPA